MRIHGKRVIENIRKKYSLLIATQPIHFLILPDASVPLFDKIVHVCCALINYVILLYHLIKKKKLSDHFYNFSVQSTEIFYNQDSINV